VSIYRQFCPVAKASEIFAERWTPLILRELLMGSHRFSEIEAGVPRISKSLLTQRLRFLERARAAGRRVFGMGAPVKGNTMLNYFGVGPDLIPCLLEKNTLRRGLYSPGMHIPILIEDEVNDVPDIYYVLAWNFKNEILNRNKKLVEQGVEFFFPVDPKVSA